MTIGFTDNEVTIKAESGSVVMSCVISRLAFNTYRCVEGYHWFRLPKTFQRVCSAGDGLRVVVLDDGINLELDNKGAMKWQMKRCRIGSDTDTDTDQKSKRRRTSSEASDRLTSLPDQILGRILSLLPTKDVSAMQVLSKRMGRAFSLIISYEASRKRKRGDDTVTDWERKSSGDTVTGWERKRKRLKCGPTSKPLCEDRLTTLTDLILGHILSLLPTKDVAVMQSVSRRMGRAFSLITTLDLDDSPISHCRCPSQKDTQLAQRFPLFKSFVVTVLGKLLLAEVEDPLTRFRLCLGEKQTKKCDVSCYPYLEPACLDVWISYPLAHSGLRDLELSFHISNPNECKLPPQLFECQSLEFLRLDANIRIDGADIPLICLPNLKLICILSIIFTGDDFLTRLVSGCPVLEDLSITDCLWDNFDHLTISSHSLRRMVLWLPLREDERTDFVTIDTPNLKYLSFVDELPKRYLVAHMNALVEAKLSIFDRSFWDAETSYPIKLSLLRALTEVHHLFLDEYFLETMSLAAELKVHLPVFRNLRTITLSAGRELGWRWDITLLLILHSAPSLETIFFPLGIFDHVHPPKYKVEADLEAQGWITNTLPSLCLAQLKRIEFGRCYGLDRELNMIRFFLGKALALEELVLCLFEDFNDPRGCRLAEPNFEEFVAKLEELPRASDSCSIIVL